MLFYVQALLETLQSGPTFQVTAPQSDECLIPADDGPRLHLVLNDSNTVPTGVSRKSLKLFEVCFLHPSRGNSLHLIHDFQSEPRLRGAGTTSWKLQVHSPPRLVLVDDVKALCR